MRCLLVVACLMAAVGAQEPELDFPVPPRPNGGVFDEARILSSEPERLEAMSQRLREFRERTGFRVEVAIVDSLIGRTVFEESQRLREAWLGDEPGLVLVLEADSGEWRIAWSERSIEADGRELPAIGPSEVGPQERLSIMNRLEALPEPRLRSSEDAGRLVDELMNGLEGTVGSAEPPQDHWGRLLLLALGLASAMLLVAMGIAAMVRRSDRQAQDRLYFPKIEVGQRLKAPRGGGKVRSRSFGASS